MEPKIDIQNIYDNPTFFEGYKTLRQKEGSLNNIVEQPALHSLLDDLSGKTILDIGSGFGDFCRYARTQGAHLIIGIDPSENMIQSARNETNNPCIQYVCSPIETYQSENNTFDIIVSSYAFHYVKDIKRVIEKISHWLKPQGQFILSTEHPICTASPKGIFRSESSGENQNESFFPIYNYRDEGAFEQKWFIDGVKKYHRTVSSYLTILMDQGFSIKKILEPMPTDEQIEAYPHLAIHKIRPPLLVISAVKIP